MAESRPKKPSRGSVTLKFKLRARNATRDLAHDMRKGTDLVSRWATGARKPGPAERAELERRYQIPWLDWNDHLSKKAERELEKKLAEEASAEPPPTFPVQPGSSVGGPRAA